MSFYICFGRWATPTIMWDRKKIRLCLGFVAVGVFFFDLEVILAQLHSALMKFLHNERERLDKVLIGETEK